MGLQCHLRILPEKGPSAERLKVHSSSSPQLRTLDLGWTDRKCKKQSTQAICKNRTNVESTAVPMMQGVVKSQIFFRANRKRWNALP